MPFGAQSTAVSSQSPQEANGPAELTQIKVDQGPDGRTRSEVIMGDPRRSALSEGNAITLTMQGARLPLSISRSWLSDPGRHGHCSDVTTQQEKPHPTGYWSATPVVVCVATVPCTQRNRTRHIRNQWTPAGYRGLQLGPH